MLNKSVVVVSVYSHPEFYPPTLNLITQLSLKFDMVHVLCRNVFETKWEYPINVKLFPVGKMMTIRESETKSIFIKILSFLKYSLSLLKLIKRNKPTLLIMCDSIPTLSYYFIEHFIGKKPSLWYHNHDVLELNKVKFFSVSWFSKLSEEYIFKILDIFTLPNLERKKYFPFDNFKGSFYLLPNYPCLDFYSQFSGAFQNKEKIRLIFQGEISSGHGIESVIKVLGASVNNKILELILVGRISYQYKEMLISLSREHKVEERVQFINFVSYNKLPEITQTCHIGLAFYYNNDVMNKTITGASNKIYEYAALRLPILTNNSNESLQQLSNFDWCVFSDLRSDDILFKIKMIDDNYIAFSASAHSSFKELLNFQNYFFQIDQTSYTKND